MVAPYPHVDMARRDMLAETTINQLIEAVRSVRNIRSELGIPPSAAVTIHIAGDGGGEHVRALEPYMKALARIQSVEWLGGGQRPSGEPSALVEGVGEIFVTLRGVVDPAEVRKRLERDLAKLHKELAGVEGKLSRPDFVDKAPVEIVDKERQRATALRERQQTLQRHLGALSGGKT